MAIVRKKKKTREDRGGSLGAELVAQASALEQRWYEAWLHEHSDHGVSEAALKNTMARQVRTIGEALASLDAEPAPAALWQVAERLAPEARVLQDFPIEEVVQEYGLLVDVVRDWIGERGLPVSFRDASYFYRCVFELVAETVRRYATFQAERVKAERSEYLAGLTHQMRTPIAALLLEAQALEGARGSAVAERLRRNASRLSLLVNGVMRLERFKPEELPVHRRTVQLAPLVDQVLRDNAHEAARKGLRLSASMDWTLAAELDPDLLLDAIGNLVQNAVKYTLRGEVRVEVSRDDHDVTLVVADTGPGLPPERATEPWTTPVRPSAGGGGGIGLVVAQRAVAAQGGAIDVACGWGKGTTITIRLPLTPT